MRRVVYVLPLAALIVFGVIATLKGGPQKVDIPDHDDRNPVQDPLDPVGRTEGDPLPEYRPPENIPTGRLQIFTHDAGRAVADVDILLVPAHGHDHEGHVEHEHFRVRTGEDGQATLVKIPPGIWFLHSKHPRYAPSRHTVRIDADQETQKQVAMILGAVVEGLVSSDTGDPLPDARVMILHPDTEMPIHQTLVGKTDKEGRYRIEGIPMETAIVYARHRHYTPYSSEAIEFRTPGEKHTIDITLTPGTFVSGQVVDPTRIPVANAMVGAGNETAYCVSTDAEGRFIIRGLGDKPVTLWVRASGYPLVYHRSIAPNTQDIEIRLEKGGSILGRVEGEGLPETFNVLLYQWQEDLGKELRVAAKTYRNPTGEFLIQDLKEGSYKISAVASGFEESEKQTVHVGMQASVTGIRIRLVSTNK